MIGAAPPRVRGTGSPYDALERVFPGTTFAWRMESIAVDLAGVRVHAVPQTLSVDDLAPNGHLARAQQLVDRINWALSGPLDYCVIAGPTPKDVVSRLTALTGRAPLPPAWSFGLWLTTSFTTQWWHLAATNEGVRSALVTSIKAATGATIIALLLGSMIAFAVARYDFFGKQPISFLVILPIMTSVVVRTFSWIVILGRQGVLNQIVMGLGLTSEQIGRAHV